MSDSEIRDSRLGQSPTADKVDDLNAVFIM